MRALRAGIVVACMACAGIVVGGCGQSEPDQVRAKVHQFIKAIAGRDYKTLCTQVLAPTLLAHLAGTGVSCEQAMQFALQGVNRPGLSIGRVDVHGKAASVITLTTASGQEASFDAIELIKTGHGWRVASLGTPQIPTK
jgi:hypothetical protein